MEKAREFDLDLHKRRIWDGGSAWSPNHCIRVIEKSAYDEAMKRIQNLRGALSESGGLSTTDIHQILVADEKEWKTNNTDSKAAE